MNETTYAAAHVAVQPVSVTAGNVWTDAVWPWLSAWLHSPGFAGAAALVAGIAFCVATRLNGARASRVRAAQWRAVSRITRRRLPPPIPARPHTTEHTTTEEATEDPDERRHT